MVAGSQSNLRQQAGFTFNELLVAMSIVVLAVMGYSLSSANVIRRQTMSSHSTVAIHLAQDKIEELQAQRTLIDGDLCPNGGDHGISANDATPGLFDRCWRIAPSWRMRKRPSDRKTSATCLSCSRPAGAFSQRLATISGSLRTW